MSTKLKNFKFVKCQANLFFSFGQRFKHTLSQNTQCPIYHPLFTFFDVLGIVPIILCFPTFFLVNVLNILPNALVVPIAPQSHLKEKKIAIVVPSFNHSTPTLVIFIDILFICSYSYSVFKLFHPSTLVIHLWLLQVCCNSPSCLHLNQGSLLNMFLHLCYFTKIHTLVSKKVSSQTCLEIVMKYVS
jgi:hypothetical protein